MSSRLSILADENISRRIVTGLRSAGYDTSWIVEIMPSATDEKVINYAIEERRLVLTSDVGLASATLRLGASHYGTILLRLPAVSQDAAAEILLNTLVTREDWHKLHAVLESSRLRTRPLV
jgi:predicted nuclease of predicted toxin-antitoxin system